MPAHFDLIVRNTSEVITAQGTPQEEAHDALRIVPGGAVGVREGRIAWIGLESALPPEAIGPGTEVLDAGGGCVTPGLVDPHTHLVFAGDRSEEFDLRCRGATYLEIARAGGGIMSTVRATRAATEDQLVELARPRLRRLLEQGVTYAEVKSGYGLDLDTELKMLRAVKRLASEQPIELVPTLLCAHAIPEELKSKREAYLDLCVNEIIPAAAREGLAVFCDAFAEESAFTLEETRRVLQAGLAHGLRPRLHADQLTPLSGSQLAAELGAGCADHLEYISDAGIEALARAGVSAVLVPTSTLYLRMQQWAPGRRLREQKVNVALGTNVNPGSSMTESVSLVMSLACLYNGLSAAEAVWGFTRGAALALGLEAHGQLRENGPADLVVFGCSTYRHLPYHLGVNHAVAVVKSGRVVARPAELGAVLCA